MSFPSEQAEDEISKTVVETVVETVGETVGETKRKILIEIEKNPYITIKKLAELIGLSVRGIEWNMKQLKSDNIIERIGPNRGGYWKIKNN